MISVLIVQGGEKNYTCVRRAILDRPCLPSRIYLMEYFNNICIVNNRYELAISAADISYESKRF